MSSIAILARVTEQLIVEYGDQAYEQELTLARDLYSERRGRVFEDDEQWESFTRAFLEYYVSERCWAETGKSPARLSAESAQDPQEAAAALALATSQRCLAEICTVKKGGVEVLDLVGGALFFVAEERSLVGMNKGDVVELRLIGFQGRVTLGRTFLYHPDNTLPAIEKVIARMRDEGASRADIIDHMALLRSRSQSYKHVSPMRIYESNGQLAGEA